MDLQTLLAWGGTAGGVGCLYLKSDLCSHPTHFSVSKSAPAEPLNPNWSLDEGGTELVFFVFLTV